MDFLIRGENPAIVDGQIRKALNGRADDLHAFARNNDISEFVSPYYVNPYQKEMLKHVLGTKNINDMVIFNTLIHTGILNNDCPTSADMSATEKIFDPITGRAQCIRPQRMNAVIDSNKFCPNDSNPFATERFVDMYGVSQCREPVLRGEFNCPPPGMDRVLDTHHVTLPDGTGICVQPPSLKSPSLLPNSLISLGMNDNTLEQKLMYEKINNYINIFNDMPMNKKILVSLSNLLKNNNLLEFKSRLQTDPNFHFASRLLKNIHCDDDMRIANLALYEKYSGSEENSKKHSGSAHRSVKTQKGGKRRRSRKN